MKTIFKNINLTKAQVIAAIIILIVGVGLGKVMFGGHKTAPEPTSAESAEQQLDQKTIWTCSMHPMIRQDHPGNCPLCGMELIPLNDENGDGETTDGPGDIQMSEAAMKIAKVQTSLVQKKAPYKEVYMPGKVKSDERRIAVITSRFPGRIEKLFVNFTGQEVSKGEKLATIYSPELVMAQKELFEAKKFEKTNPSFYRSATNKLKLWDLTDQQIEEILEKGEPQFYFDVVAPQSGTVTERVVTLGSYVREGSALLQIADLNQVWVMFDAYEIDLPWIKLGDKVNFTVKSLANQEFTSTVTFIHPVINPQTRAASVRTELSNPGGKLKPEMYATGILKTMLHGKNEALVIPKTSVLWTGKRSVVYVKKPGTDHAFSYREIELGPQASDFFVVASGLEEGEEIATNGVFKIDAAAQLQSKQSMMNPEGGKASMGHDHGDMGDGEMKESSGQDHEGHNMSSENPSM